MFLSVSQDPQLLCGGANNQTFPMSVVHGVEKVGRLSSNISVSMHNIPFVEKEGRARKILCFYQLRIFYEYMLQANYNNESGREIESHF